MTINFENGNKIVLNAPNNSEEKNYINSINLNGKIYNNNWIDQEKLLKGAIVNFSMSAQPNKRRGAEPSDFPYSLSNDK